jgi:hypothetical protein
MAPFSLSFPNNKTRAAPNRLHFLSISFRRNHFILVEIYAFMKPKTSILILIPILLCVSFKSVATIPPPDTTAPVGLKRYLYVAVPGIRDYLRYGGHGILVLILIETISLSNVLALMVFTLIKRRPMLRALQ